MRFTFIHAADLHIDSPLAGLRLKDGDVARRFAEAGRRAVHALVEETIASKAAFLIIAGDVFDGDWKDVTTGLFFVSAISALHRAGIPVFIVKGNHDAESLMSRDLPYPDSVKVFRANAAETVAIDELRVALHGRSFPNRLTGDFVETYPARREGWLNIGVLHTSLDGTRGHQGCAPCSADDLKRFGYQGGDLPQNVNFAVKSVILATYLNSNDVAIHSGSPGEKPLDPADLADRAKEISAFVLCGNR